MEQNADKIDSLELAAANLGYGPRVPCTFVASPSEQKTKCRMFFVWFRSSENDVFCQAHLHRRHDKGLDYGDLLKWKHLCKAVYDIFVPNKLEECPRVVVICKNVHNHRAPAPVNTPPPLVDVLKGLLLDMDWLLADATPRRIILDSGFMRGLRRALGWSAQLSPTLSDLHPSLTNLDHLRRIINVLRTEKYPDGTGFEGNDSSFCVPLIMINDI